MKTYSKNETVWAITRLFLHISVLCQIVF